MIPRVYTYYISTVLFAIFGLKMLRDGYYMSPNDGQEELEEVQSDLKKREDEVITVNTPEVFSSPQMASYYNIVISVINVINWNINNIING